MADQKNAHPTLTGAEILVDGGQTLHGYPRWFSADYAKVGAEWTPHTQR